MTTATTTPAARDCQPDQPTDRDVAKNHAAWLSPAAAAAELQTRRGTILLWIRRAELIAFNLAEKTTGRPRWKIRRADLEEFLQRRRCQPPAPRPPRRRKLPEGVIEFYK